MKIYIIHRYVFFHPGNFVSQQKQELELLESSIFSGKGLEPIKHTTQQLSNPSRKVFFIMSPEYTKMHKSYTQRPQQAQ